MDKQNELERLLKAAAAFHGHLCGGQIIGVRMGMAGLRELKIIDPHGEERKDFIAFVETDRCATDAILTVTGLTPGKRSLKILDYGKMAATFVHLKSGRAVRISSLESSREKAEQLAATYDMKNEQEAYLRALKELPEDVLLDIREVRVPLEPCDLPGVPVRMTVCSICGEQILDGRDVVKDGTVYCKPCASGRTYYQPFEAPSESASKQLENAS